MTSDLALNELQSNERRFGDDFGPNCIQNELNSDTNSNDNHLSTTNGQQLSPLGSANSSLSSPKEEPKQETHLKTQLKTQQKTSNNSFNDLIKNLNDFENNHHKSCKNSFINSSELHLSSAEDPKRIKCCDSLSVVDIKDINDENSDETNCKLFKFSSNDIKTNENSNHNIRRVVLDEQTLMSLTVNEFRHHWTQQQLYINYIESQLEQLNRDKSDLISLRESEEKLKQQQLEANRRENVLVMRLTTKEQEMQEYLVFTFNYLCLDFPIILLFLLLMRGLTRLFTNVSINRFVLLILL